MTDEKYAALKDQIRAHPLDGVLVPSAGNVAEWAKKKDSDPFCRAMYDIYDGIYQQDIKGEYSQKSGGGRNALTLSSKYFYETYIHGNDGVQSLFLQDAIKKKIGRDLSEAEMAAWCTSLVAEHRDDLVSSDLEAGLMKKKKKGSKLTKEEFLEVLMYEDLYGAETAQEKAQKEDVEEMGDSDVGRRLDDGDEDGQDQADGKKKKKTQRGGQDDAGEQAGPGGAKNGAVFQNIDAPGAAGPVQGSAWYVQTMSQAQHQYNIGAISLDKYRQIAIVSSVLDGWQKQEKLFGDMQDNAEFLRKSNYSTFRMRRLAKDISRVSDESRRLAVEAGGMFDLIEKGLLDSVGTRLESEGIDTKSARLSGGAGRPHPENPGTPGGDNNKKSVPKPKGHRSFPAMAPLLFIKNVPGRIQESISEAMEKNKSRKAERDDARKAYADVIDEKPEEGVDPPSNEAKGLFSRMRDAVSSKMTDIRQAFAKKPGDPPNADHPEDEDDYDYPEDYDPLADPDAEESDIFVPGPPESAVEDDQKDDPNSSASNDRKDDREDDPNPDIPDGRKDDPEPDIPDGQEDDPEPDIPDGQEADTENVPKPAVPAEAGDIPVSAVPDVQKLAEKSDEIGRIAAEGSDVADAAAEQVDSTNERLLEALSARTEQAAALTKAAIPSPEQRTVANLFGPRTGGSGQDAAKRLEQQSNEAGNRGQAGNDPEFGA